MYLITTPIVTSISAESNVDFVLNKLLAALERVGVYMRRLMVMSHYYFSRWKILGDYIRSDEAGSEAISAKSISPSLLRKINVYRLSNE